MKFENPFENKTVTLMGLGKFAKGSGISAAKFIAPLCKKLIITDIKTKEELEKQIKSLSKFKNITYHLGGHKEKDFTDVDWVIRNPDVPAASPYLALARKNKIPIDNDVSLFLRIYGMENVIGVTGTKGKTTTTHLIHNIVKQQYPDARIGGNVGLSPLTFLNSIKEGTPVVLELSSFLLHEFAVRRFSPHVSVWTNLYEDHLNKYKNLDAYIADKRNIFAYQKKKDFAIVNADDPVVKKGSLKGNAVVERFSPKKDIKKFQKYFNASSLLGGHNKANIMAAVLACRSFGITESNIIKGIKSFKGVPYRLELIRTLRGVKWYNDSTATAPEAAVAALKAFPKKTVVVITGGNTKGSDLSELKKTQKQYAKEVLLIPGNANNNLAQGIEVLDLKEAVLVASRIAKKGDVVVLSPGLTWLPRINEFERGDELVKLVNKL